MYTSLPERYTLGVYHAVPGYTLGVYHAVPGYTTVLGREMPLRRVLLSPCVRETSAQSAPLFTILWEIGEVTRRVLSPLMLLM